MLIKGAFCKFLCSASSCANTTSVLGFYTDTYWNGCMKFVYLLLPLHNLHRCFILLLFNYFSLSCIIILGVNLSHFVHVVDSVCSYMTACCNSLVYVSSLSAVAELDAFCSVAAVTIMCLWTWCPNIYSQSVVWELQTVEVCLMILARNVCFDILCFLLNSLSLECLVDHTHILIHTITLDYPVDSGSVVMLCLLYRYVYYIVYIFCYIIWFVSM